MYAKAKPNKIPIDKETMNDLAILTGLYTPRGKSIIEVKTTHMSNRKLQVTV